MFKPLFIYIAWRYIRAKKRNRFLSFISMASMLGIALGVCVLITVLSVMNGFDQQIRERIFSMAPHVIITGESGTLDHWQKLPPKLKSFSMIRGAAPFVSGQAMLVKGTFVHPVILKGILPKEENHVSEVGRQMVQGALDELVPKRFGIVLGQQLAWSINANVGDSINLVTPKAVMSPMGLLPRFKRFTVIGIFRSGTGFGFDENYAYIHLKDAQQLYILNDQVSGLQLKLANLFAARQISWQLSKSLGFSYQVSNWTEQYGGFYRAVQMEKTIMFFILLLLIAIAAFNLVASLVMLVNEKQSDIAILRTIGSTPQLITKIFIMQGCMIGIIGTFFGILCGVLLSLHVTALANWIQQTFHVQLLTSDVYFVNYLPSKLQINDVIKVMIVALSMSLLSTIYPAWKAARIKPAEALRYE
jgi:lipoprotein-releasing system permease protein